MSIIGRFFTGQFAKHADASDRLDKAADELSRTVSMSRAEFLRAAEKDRLKDIRAVVHFDTFSAICEYRYSPPDSLMVLCKNPEHEGAEACIAACLEDICPKLKKAANEK